VTVRTSPMTHAFESVNVVRFVWNHPANRGRKARAVLRAIRYQLYGRLLHQRSIVRIGTRSRLWVDLHRRGASKAVYGNPPDYQEMLVWQQFLRPGDLFVDVGANVGSYTIWAADLGAEIIALEPAEDTFALLQENIDLNGYAVKAIRAVAGSTCGNVRFTSGLDTVNRVAEGGDVEAAMVTIDSVIGDRTAAGMKIDVEGFEIEVLRGCMRALSDQRIKLIQVEWNEQSREGVETDRQPIADLLAECGYALYRPDEHGTLISVSNPGFGPDVFAQPAHNFAALGEST
jgi:FkbM family methyltransferase